MTAANTLEAYLDSYLDAAGILGRGKSPLFRSAVWHSGILTENAMHRIDAWRMMIQRRAAALGLKARITCHAQRTGTRRCGRAAFHCAVLRTTREE
jgi:hypothetical protein